MSVFVAYVGWGIYEPRLEAFRHRTSTVLPDPQTRPPRSAQGQAGRCDNESTSPWRETPGVGLRFWRPGGAVSLRSNGAREQGAAPAARAVLLFLVQGAVGAILIRLWRLLHVLEGVYHLLTLLLLGVREARQVRAVGLCGRRATIAGLRLARAAIARSIGPAAACCEERPARADYACNAKGVEKASPRYVGLIVGSHKRGVRLVKERVRGVG